MAIKRINEFPEGSGNLSNDDIFLFMDDPLGSGITKKISLSQISSVIGGGGSGHAHVVSQITDFNSAVSALLPVKNILAGSNVTISSIDGEFTINSTASGTGGSVLSDSIHPFLLGGM